jgi:hypothetical protein
MSWKKLYRDLERCNGKFVTIEIEGGITVPYFIENFEFGNGQETIYFGEHECENFPFIIYKNTISNIEFLSDIDEMVHVCFDVRNDGFVTKLWIQCDDVEVTADE